MSAAPAPASTKSPRQKGAALLPNPMDHGSEHDTPRSEPQPRVAERSESRAEANPIAATVESPGRKMGRPKGSTGSGPNRSERITILLSSQERVAIEKAASKSHVSPPVFTRMKVLDAIGFAEKKR